MKRNQSLDVLRCIAVLLVLGVHVPYYRAWAHIGWAGVDLFFVLSGFLISGLLFRDYLEHGSINWKRFLIRRGFKIYPALYVLLAFTGILAAAITHQPHLPRILLENAFFAGNYLHNSLVGPFGHLWSVVVEEHFYVLLPFLLVSLGKRRSADPFHSLPWIFLMLAIACLAFRVFTHSPGMYLQPGGYAFMTHMRIDSLFAGVTLGYLYHFKRAWFRRFSGHSALAASIAFCAPAMIFAQGSRGMQTIGLTSMYVGFAFLVAWSVERAPRSTVGVAISRAAASIGFYSYSIYLWHIIVAFTFKQLPQSALLFWFYIALSVALGIVMAKAVELPALALRERLFPAGQRVSAFQNLKFPIMITSTILPSLAHVGGVESSDLSK